MDTYFVTTKRRTQKTKQNQKFLLKKRHILLSLLLLFYFPAFIAVIARDSLSEPASSMLPVRTDEKENSVSESPLTKPPTVIETVPPESGTVLTSISSVSSGANTTVEINGRGVYVPAGEDYQQKIVEDSAQTTVHITSQSDGESSSNSSSHIKINVSSHSTKQGVSP
ncbi:MAG: hypothetical protein JWN33_54 [Candidatus Saccharibacteria bacterium]|nr:hypothetical protein [Candidatus Saccharibacteria bacterium]